MHELSIATLTKKQQDAFLQKCPAGINTVDAFERLTSDAKEKLLTKHMPGYASAGSNAKGMGSNYFRAPANPKA